MKKKDTNRTGTASNPATKNDGHKHIIVIHSEDGEGKKGTTEIRIEDANNLDLLRAYASVSAAIAGHFVESGDRMLVLSAAMAGISEAFEKSEDDAAENTALN